MTISWQDVAFIAVIMAGSGIIAWAHAWRRVHLAKITNGESEMIRKGYTWSRTRKTDPEGFDLDEDEDDQ